jgi:predicted RNase H-like HicB family nuclease
MHYRMLIGWSDENDCFLVLLPDFEGRIYQPVTDGKTYEEAARNGQEALELLTEDEPDIPELVLHEHDTEAQRLTAATSQLAD